MAKRNSLKLENNYIKDTKSELKKALEFGESKIKTDRQPRNVLGIISAYRSFYSTFKVKSNEKEGQFINDLGNKQWDIPAFRNYWKRLYLFPLDNLSI